MCAYLCKVFRGTLGSHSEGGELAQGTHTSVRTLRLQVILPRGQKKRLETLGGLWEYAWVALAETGVTHRFGSRKEEAG